MQGSLVLYKNKGTNDPFNARLLFGVLHLRDYIVSSDDERLEFDKLYTPVLENLDDCFECKDELIQLINNHKEKILNKKIIEFQNDYETLEVKESIDRKMNQLFKDFIIKGEIAIKSLQFLTKKYGLDIGFFFKNEKDFQDGINLLRKSNEFDQSLAEMLLNDRKWRSAFNEIRTSIEHGGFSLGNVKYRHQKDDVSVNLPQINGIDVDEVVLIFGKNVFELVEDLLALMVSKNLKDPFCIVCIPEAERDPSMPKKYVVSVRDIPTSK